METPSPPAEHLIARDVREIEAFAAELGEFLRRIAGAPLFDHRPTMDPPETAIRLLEEGGRLLRPAEYQLKEEACETAASVLLALMRNRLAERENDVVCIQDAFGTDALQPMDFVSSAFRDEVDEMIGEAHKLNLDEDLMGFMAVYLARPFRDDAARSLAEGLDLGKWQRGHCPVCGHWPFLAHIDAAAGARTLWCAHCGTHWPFKRLQCPYCLNEDQGTLELISAISDTSYRVHACMRCGRYMKEVRSGEAAEKFPYDAVFLGTYALDLIAREEGYVQESPLAAPFGDSG